MANPFYNASGSPVTGSPGLSAVMRAEFAAINAGFNLLPNVLTPNYIVVVNPAGTALTVSNSFTGFTFQDPTFTGNVTINPAAIFTLPDGSIWNNLGLQHAVTSVVSMPDGSQWNSTLLKNVSNIGIGMVPANPLDITRSVNSQSAISLLNPNAGTSAFSLITAATATGSLSLVQWGANFTTAGVNRQDGSTLQSVGAGGLTFNTATAPRAMYWCQNSIERMRLDVSGNLGVGVVPPPWGSYRAISIGLGGAIAGDLASGVIFSASNIYFDGATWRLVTAGTGGYFASGGGEYAWTSTGSFGANAAVVPAERMRLVAAGNLGIGRTPEAWDAGNKGIAFGATGSLYAANAAGSAVVSLVCNSYFDGVSHRYINANPASLFLLGNGDHVWYSAPLGVAGAVAAYVERARLTASGFFGIGLNPTNLLDMRQDVTTGTVARLANLFNGPTAYCGYQVQNNAGNSGVLRIQCTAFTASGIIFNDSVTLLSNASNGLAILTAVVQPIYFGINTQLVGKWATSGAFQAINAGVTGALYTNNVSSDDGAGMYVIAGSNLQLCFRNGSTWGYASTREIKRDFEPFTEDPFAIISSHDVSLFRRKDDEDDAPLRLGVYYEDAKKYFPFAAVDAPPHDVMDGSTGKLVHSGPFKGIAITNYIPLLMLALQKQIAINATLEARLAAGGL